jgi:hypothetical protein
MAQAGGWNFWVETNGKVRLFVVAEGDERAAEGMLQAGTPGVESASVMSRQQLPAREIELFGMRPGEVREMEPGTASNELDEGGDVDLKRPV